MTWHPIAGFPGYVINVHGVVQGRKWALSPAPRNGYLRVALYLDGKRSNRPVHLLVLAAFGPPQPSPTHEGAHLDGDRQNNHASNLVWKTRLENEADKRRHGTATSGATRVRLTPRQLAHARKMYASGASFTAIAKRYGAHRYTVARLLRA